MVQDSGNRAWLYRTKDSTFLSTAVDRKARQLNWVSMYQNGKCKINNCWTNIGSWVPKCCIFQHWTSSLLSWFPQMLLSATPTQMSATQAGVFVASQSISLSPNGISLSRCLRLFLRTWNFSRVFVHFSFNWFCNCGQQVEGRIFKNFMMQRIHRNFLAYYDAARLVPSDFWL